MAKEKKIPTTALVEALAKPVAEEYGVQIWDVRFEKEGSLWYLRIFIDKDGGVDINDCENVSRKLSDILDEKDPIEQSYILEVSSPGVERDLVRKEHFDAFIGSMINVRFIRPVEGVRDFSGELVSADENGNVTILIDVDVEMTFHMSETAFVRLRDDFDMGGLE